MLSFKWNNDSLEISDFCHPTRSALWILIVLFCLASCRSESELSSNLEAYIEGLPRGTSVVDPEVTEFDTLFQFNRVIEIDSSVVIGSVNRMTVGYGGRFLLVDKPSNQAVLLDSEGSLLKTLSPEACHPGYNWRPKEAMSMGQDGWLVLVNGPGGFLFDLDGNCTQQFGDGSSSNYAQFTIANSKRGFGLRSTVEGIRLDAVDIPSGQSSNILLSGSSNLLNRMVTLGGMEWVAGDMLIGFPTTPIILRMQDGSATKGHISGLGSAPGYYRHVTEDLTLEENSIGSTAIERMYEIMNSSSIVFDIHAVDDRTLVVLHYNQFEKGQDNGREFGLQVIDIVDETTIAEGVHVSSKSAPIAAGNGNLYSLKHDDMESNPSIVEFLYVRPE